MPSHWTLFSAVALAVSIFLTGCAGPPERQPLTSKVLTSEIAKATTVVPARVPTQISDALLAEPPPSAQRSAPRPSEPRFDLVFNRANARDVFLALVTDTPMSMTLHPDVEGLMSMTLRRVTLREALDAIRDVYGYDFRYEGNRVSVFPPAPQTRAFTVNYLTSQRAGRSQIRVNSGGTPSQGAQGQAATNPQANGLSQASSDLAGSASQNTQVETTSRSDLWTEVTAAIQTIVGKEPGRHVFVTPQAGIVTVRAMPEELRQVESYLRSVRGAVERQVMLEAKIIDLELSDGFQSGVDWTQLATFNNGGKATVGTQSGAPGVLLTPDALGMRGLPAISASGISGALGLPAAAGGAIGLAISTARFEGVLAFLESFGDAQVLSSPRVATLNNQRALLKVGTDEYFITGISGGATTTTTTATGVVPQTTLPNVNLSQFFSGIALDVTPQIDDANNITLHMHPSVSVVQEKSKQIDLGTAGSFKLPLATSNINETDTIVRVQDGNIVAIGGLMQTESNSGASGLPGSSQSNMFRSLLGNQKRSSRKRELIILIKPTIIRNADDWAQASRETQVRIDELESQLREPVSRVIRVPSADTPKVTGK